MPVEQQAALLTLVYRGQGLANVSSKSFLHTVNNFCILSHSYLSLVISLDWLPVISSNDNQCGVTFVSNG